jgi:GT2 family glycosyltransferase/2-polyprenyl-3-methyl-5-hydroxy-6-metoxy-1,4-benzoquinol methylase
VDLSSNRYEPDKIDLSNPNVVYTIEASLVGKNKKVLEVGCSTGYFTKILKDFGNEVYCIEIDREAAKLAEKHCNSIVIGDIEDLNLEYHFKEKFFDVVLFGDVLEHLKDPERVLRKIKGFLKDDGYVVASIPNIAHGDVILNLMAGKFDYRPLGLLDKTHLRFFTLRSIKEMFERCGFKIAEIYTTKVEVGYTELGEVVKSFPAPIVNFIKKLPYSNVYQFVVKAYHAESSIKEAELPEPSYSSIQIEEIAELQRKIFELEKELILRYQEIDNLKDVLSSVKEEKQKIESYVQKLEGELSKIKAELEIGNREKEKLKSELIEKSISFERLLKAYDETLRNFNKLKVELINLKNKLKNTLIENSKLQESLSERERELETLKMEIEKKEEAIKTKDDEIEKLKNNLALKDEEIRRMNEEILRLSSELHSIKSSFTWRALMKWHAFVERIAPLGTRRRKWYDLGIIGLRTIANEGFKSFLQKFFRYTRLNTFTIKKVCYPIFKVDMTHLGTHEPLELSKELLIKFKARANNLCELKILTATYRRKNSDLEVIIDAGKEFRSVVIKGEKIPDNQYMSIKFRPIKECEGKEITVRIKSKPPAAAVWFNRNVEHEGLEIFYDGEKIRGCINIEAYYDLKIRDEYECWILRNEPRDFELKEMARDQEKFRYRPKISIIMPTYNSNIKWLKKAIDSVLYQIYDNWELCIADGGSKKDVRNILKKYSKKDKRIKVVFLDKNLGIAGNSNEALKLATGDFITFLDHDDELAPFALYEFVKLLNEKPELDFIYSDEDKIDEAGRRVEPFFKPDYSPDMFLSTNYLCHTSIIRKSLVEKVGGFRVGYDGSQDYDLFLRVLEHTNKVAHIPKILYHWRKTPTSTASSPMVKLYAFESAKRALADAMKRRGIPIEGVYDSQYYGYYRIKYKIIGNPKVSIIIPTKDNVEILKECVNSILDNTFYQNYEILIVDNNSLEDTTHQYYEEIKGNPKIKLIEYKKPFNFSAIINYAVSKIKNEYIVFLNNDTKVITGEWLSAMLEHAQRREVGAVGAKLLYPDGRIQHAGVILGLGLGKHRVAGHMHRGLPDNLPGYFARPHIIQNLSAVTAACMMTKRSVFEEVGGFDEVNLPVAFNDVDYCLKLRQKGYLIVYTPYATLYHHEGFSRGRDDVNRPRFLREIEYMRKKWGTILDNDPYYNPNLTKEREDLSIRI